MIRFCLAGSYPDDETKIGGGVVHAVYTLAQTFAEIDDIDFHVVSSSSEASDVKTVESKGMTIHYVPYSKNKLLPNVLTQPSRLAPIFKSLNPDIVCSQNCEATLGAVKAGCKVLHTIHGIVHYEIPYTKGYERLSKYLLSVLEKKAVSRATAVVGVAQYALNEYADYINTDKYTMYLPVEDVFWKVPEMNQSVNILFAGAVCKRKNLEVIVKAMPDIIKNHPNTILHVCGSTNQDSYYDQVKQLIVNNNLENNIVFHGVVDRVKLTELLKTCIALVIPSYQETTPTVIAQVMAAGRVPIASNVGATNEMIDNEVTGYIIEPDDYVSLAYHINDLLDNESKAKQIAGNARQVASSRYERHIVAKSILSICDKVLNKV